ncbi:MAG: ABC transporter permease [Alkalimonas sp.]|nr:ABC transporter permease [Alkalimonas sp.]
MSAAVQVIKREVQHLQRDRGDCFLTFALLPVLCLLVAWIFSAGQPDHIAISVVDHDQSSVSRQLIRLIDASPAVEVVRRDSSVSAAVDAMRQRKVYAVFVLPEQLEASIYQGSSADLLLHYNAQYTSYASTVTRAVQQTVMTAAIGISTDRRQRSGESATDALATMHPIAVIATPLFNSGPSYEVFLAATLIPALFQIIAMVIAVSIVGRELRDGTATQWLDTAQGSLFTALFAKFLPYFLTLALYGAIYVLFFRQLNPESYLGSGLLIYAALLLMTTAAMAVGMLLVGCTRNFRMALSLAGFYSAPAFAFSGQAFPLVAMPALAQYWAGLLPLTYWLKLYNQQWLAGAPLSSSYPPVLVLLGISLFATALGSYLLRRVAFVPGNWGAR